MKILLDIFIIDMLNIKKKTPSPKEFSKNISEA